MDERLTAADAALKAGRRAEACDLIIAVLKDAPDQPAQTYRILTLNLYQLGRYPDGAQWGAEGTRRFPKDFHLWNIYGVVLRRLTRYDEALKALDQAQKLNPKDTSPLVNKGNIHNDRGDGAAAEAIFAKLVRQEPRSAELQRALGRALLNQDKYEQAIVRFKQAVGLKPDYVDSWLDYSGALGRLLRFDTALEVLDRALGLLPDEARLLEAKAVMLQRAGQPQAAEAFLKGLLPKYETAGWLHFQSACAVADRDRLRANQHFHRAVELEPDRAEFLIAMAESLERSRYGDEGDNIEQAYDQLRRAMALGPLTSNGKKIASDIMIRVGAFDEIDELGTFQELGREWAANGRQTALLKMLSRVKTPADRRELLHQHRIWGKIAEASARRNPIRKPPGPRNKDKIRLGFMSSDLRNHPVAYFCLPLFDHYDHEKFEIYCYSYYQGKEDTTQQYIASKVDAFRWRQDISDRDAAQMIADDQLDMLIELGGSTHMNKLEVMAYKPAPLSASWLGYPHSAGLNTIDYLFVDPFMMPEDHALLLEKPLMLPHAWYALGERAFREEPAVATPGPAARNGYVTFGTANNPYKYSAEMLAVWAEVVARTPNSRFLFVRPEAGAPTFRRNMQKIFADHGVSEDRILFQAIRGVHLPFYNEMDISLDAFPQTGGTTTCESLWMGVPVVTLVGETLFERLSYSVLMNLDLGHLCATTPQQYIEIATGLAQRPAEIAALRAGLRQRMKDSPLGQTRAFAQDFYAIVEKAVKAKR